jgi:hypothetical protein
MAFVKKFKDFIFESEMTVDDFKKIVDSSVTMVKTQAKKLVDIELSYTKLLKEAKSADERSRIYAEMEKKKDEVMKDLDEFTQKQGELSQSQMSSFKSWMDSAVDYMVSKNKLELEASFAAQGADTAKWKTVNDPEMSKRMYDLACAEFTGTNNFQCPIL